VHGGPLTGAAGRVSALQSIWQFFICKSGPRPTVLRSQNRTYAPIITATLPLAFGSLGFLSKAAPADWTSQNTAYACIFLIFSLFLTGFAAFFIDFNKNFCYNNKKSLIFFVFTTGLSQKPQKSS
jgi:hypothetical protein